MANAASKQTALLQFTQISSDILDNRYIQHLKNIVFILVLLNYWGKLYNKVLVAGPVRAYQDLKSCIFKVILYQLIVKYKNEPFH